MSRKPKYKLKKSFLLKEYQKNKKSTTQIANQIGCSTNTVNFWIKKHKIPLRKQGTHRIRDIVGETFGNWTVLKQAESDPRTKYSRWLCRCNCGTELIIHYGGLLSGKRNRCRRCFAVSKINKEELKDTIWSKIKYGAEKRKIPFTITKDEAYKLFLKQGKKCNLTGWDIEFAHTITLYFKGGNTASLDRIDSKQGYCLGNVQWVHKHVNIMKNKFEQIYFYKLCRAVSQHKKRS